MKIPIILFIVQCLKINLIVAKAIPGENVMLSFNPDEEKCIRELSFNKQYVLKVSRTKQLPDNDDVYNRYIECVFKRMTFQDFHGNVHYDIIRNYLQVEVPKHVELSESREFFVKQAIRQAVTYCQNNENEGSNDGHVAVRAWICILTKLEEARNRFPP